MPGKIKDEPGNRYGKLTVRRFADRGKRGHSRWLCRCDCGTYLLVLGTSLRSGNTASCGCALKTRVIPAEAHTSGKTPTGGHIRRVNGKLVTSPEYSCWGHIKSRCFNPNARNFIHYGGRGITMCERWIQSFTEFFADMGLRPSPKHSIERINNDGNYEPGNCRWATHSEQNANRRPNKKRSTATVTQAAA